MTDETIKINREMLREAWEKARAQMLECHAPVVLSCLEEFIFGPKKPREVWIQETEGNLGWVSSLPQLESKPGVVWRRFREVTGE